MDFLFVKSTTDKGYGTIYARIRKNDLNKKFSVGYRITKNEWKAYRKGLYNCDTVMPSIGILYEDFSTILRHIKHYFYSDHFLGDAAEAIKKIKMEVLYNEDISVWHRKGVNIFLDDFLYSFYEDLLEGRRFKRGTVQKVSKHYARHFRTARSYLIEYQESISRRFTLDDIDMDFRDGFVEWCYSKGLMTNTLRTYIGMIYYCMIVAFEEHLTDNDISRYHIFRINGEKRKSVYVTNEQTDFLFSLDFSSVDDVRTLIKEHVTDQQKKREYCDEITDTIVNNLRRSLDVFLVGVLTGQRYSDYIRITQRMFTKIDDEWFIHFVQSKTGKDVYVPLDVRTKAILDRNGGSLPLCSRSTLNNFIKLLFRYIGWDYDTGIERKVLGKTLSSRFCDMVSSKTARRSFITNAVIAGINSESIMTVTGHFNETNFNMYVSMDYEQRGEVAAKDFGDFMDL